MEHLIKGLHKFRDQIVVSNRRFFQSLADGQNPSAMFISCSDSRVNPDFITQSKPGELFVCRNAGCIIPPYTNDIPSGETATIEYAIAVLKIRDMVVCGHSHCGAMSAIANNTPLHDLPAVQHWLKYADRTRKIIEKNYNHLQGSQRVMATVQENVLVQLEHLRTHPCVVRAVEAGELSLHGWVFEIETGEAYTYDESKGQFTLIGGDKSHSHVRLAEVE